VISPPHCETCTCRPKTHQHRLGDLELRLNDPKKSPSPRLEIVQWELSGHCFTVALWQWDKDGMADLRFVGRRPLDADTFTFWKLVREGQDIAERGDVREYA
jgi:hypothetical protein